MSRKYHELKLETEYYQAIERGFKKFEIRKNDRDFKVHDMVRFREVVSGVHTGRSLHSLEISYIITDKEAGKYGLSEGHCIFCW